MLILGKQKYRKNWKKYIKCLKKRKTFFKQKLFRRTATREVPSATGHACLPPEGLRGPDESSGGKAGVDETVTHNMDIKTLGVYSQWC